MSHLGLEHNVIIVLTGEADMAIFELLFEDHISYLSRFKIIYLDDLNYGVLIILPRNLFH